jgi:hypothetical protein
MYKQCNMTSCTCNMSVYLGKDQQTATQMIIGKYEIVKMVIFLSSPFFSPSHKAIGCWGNVRRNCKVVLKGTVKTKIRRGTVIIG